MLSDEIGIALDTGGNGIVVRSSVAMESTHGNAFVGDLTVRMWDAIAGAVG